MNEIDNEIMKASDAIDKALAHMNKESRGEISVNILAVIRNLNDHIASKIWRDIEPTQTMDINKVASKLCNKKPFKFIARFDKYLRKSVSHFTPSEDGAERLMIKYFKYLLDLKKIVKVRYKMDILYNIYYFLEDTDKQTKDYYIQVAKNINNQKKAVYNKIESDNYYIHRVKPFYIDGEINYEVTLEPADEKPNKFGRIIAFTKFDINTTYCISASLFENYIDVFGVRMPIKIISDWQVSIRPCEINNFAKIFNMSIKVQRGHNEYKSLMNYLKEEEITLVDLIDYSDIDYNMAKKSITDSTKDKSSIIFKILDTCREISNNNCSGKNILRYLLYRMNNRLIKDQLPYNSLSKCLRGFNLSSSCFPFEDKPFVFNPKGHLSNYFDLTECIDTDGRESELLARFIKNNTEKNGKLYTSILDLKGFGGDDEVKRLIKEYNENIYVGFKPKAELGIYCDHVFYNEHEQTTFFALSELLKMSPYNSEFATRFSPEKLRVLIESKDATNKLDDAQKREILENMYVNAKVHLIYGAAGTGKTTLINHISQLMKGTRRIFLAKTNPAVENIRRRVVDKELDDEFITIDKFIKNDYYQLRDFDLIVIDECSTVKNEEIESIIRVHASSHFILVGDIYQIEAIGYGNWFALAKMIMPTNCSHELNTPFRSIDSNLKELWREVRNLSDDNTTLEQLVRHDYSHVIDRTIFEQKNDDEIILCLNYNGLYGLNNINKLLQLGNPNKSYDIGVWSYKINDPILFNDSARFKILYNNLKGRIVDILDEENLLKFVIDIELTLCTNDIDDCTGLALIDSDGKKSRISFWVNRRPPYSSDEEETGNAHVIPFQVAYAVSIHKSQGLEYESVKIVIADDTEELISHNIFYTAITRAKSYLTLYWSPEVCNRVLANLKPKNNSLDYILLKQKYDI